MAAPLPTARRKRHGTKKTALLWLLWLWALLAGTTLPVDGGRVRATSPVRFGRVEDVCRGEGVLFAPALLYDADAGNARSLPFGRAAVYAPDGETVAAGTPLFATPTGETVTAPVDGWFRTECDGWESVWSGVDPAALDLSLYDETANEPPGKPPAAKLVTGGAVYAAFVVEDAPDLRPGARCPLTLPDGTRHVCELLSLDTDGARTLLVARLTCSPAVLEQRRGAFFLTTATVRGARVDPTAIRRADDGTPYLLVAADGRATPRAVALTPLSDGGVCVMPSVRRTTVEGRRVLPLREGDRLITETEGLEPYDELYRPRQRKLFLNFSDTRRRQ